MNRKINKLRGSKAMRQPGPMDPYLGDKLTEILNWCRRSEYWSNRYRTALEEIASLPTYEDNYTREEMRAIAEAALEE